MQEWNLQGGLRRSSSSETPFSDGQSVRSVLCLSDESGLERLDFSLEEEIDLGGRRPVAQWVRVFRSNEAEQAVEREAVETVEELFVQLIEGEDPPAADGDDPADESEAEAVRSALKFLLALHLERKRILRPLGRLSPDGSQLYRHARRDREYRIFPAEVGVGLVRKIEEQLDLVLV